MKFKIGISGDLINSDGLPCFGEGSLEKIYNRKDLQMEWINPSILELSQDLTAKYDAILLNLPKANKESVKRKDCRLKIISRFGVGFDSVDIKAMKDKGIIVANTPNAVRRPVAVAALTMVFALSGKLFLKDDLLRSDKWNERTNHMGFGLTKKVLGIIGCGSIGSELVKLSAPFFGKVVGYDPFVSKEEMFKKGIEKLDFHDLATQSDFVVVLCNLNKDTEGLVDIDFLKKMKKNAFFINMSRGPVVNEKDLVFVLEKNLIAGAGLDVFNEEPINKNNKLLNLKNTILTPHALCWTDECFSEIANEAISNILNYVDGKPIQNRVN